MKYCWKSLVTYRLTMYVLRNVARVSKRFKKLSEDPFLIRKIELHPVGHSMYAKGQFRYCLKVLKTSKKVMFFSFDLEWKFAWSNSQAYKNFLRILSNINHGYLKYFCIKVEHRLNDTSDSKASLIGKLMRYLEKCPNLKILKIEFTETKHYPDEDYMFDGGVTFRDLAWLDEKAILEFRFQNLEELHLNGFDLGPLLPDQAFRSRFAALKYSEWIREHFKQVSCKLSQTSKIVFEARQHCQYWSILVSWSCWMWSNSSKICLWKKCRDRNHRHTRVQAPCGRGSTLECFQNLHQLQLRISNSKTRCCVKNGFSNGTHQCNYAFLPPIYQKKCHIKKRNIISRVHQKLNSLWFKTKTGHSI